jgi:Flp pilus assembly protein TadB
MRHGKRLSASLPEYLETAARRADDGAPPRAAVSMRAHRTTDSSLRLLPGS